jgi:sulfoxide reductase heme-binding subunit YedZ
MSRAGSYTDPSQHVFWLTSRSLGVVAMLLVSVSVGLGLALSGRMSSRPGGPARLKTLHEAVSLTALVAIAGHGLVLMGDSYLDPGLNGILVPFAMQVKPFWNGIGIIGGWLAAVLGLSFYARRWIGVATWRRLHRWTILVYVLGLAHTIGSGTDTASAWVVLMLALVGVPVVIVGARRLLPPEPPSAAAASTARARQTTGPTGRAGQTAV